MLKARKPLSRTVCWGLRAQGWISHGCSFGLVGDGRRGRNRNRGQWRRQAGGRAGAQRLRDRQWTRTLAPVDLELWSLRLWCESVYGGRICFPFPRGFKHTQGLWNLVGKLHDCVFLDSLVEIWHLKGQSRESRKGLLFGLLEYLTLIRSIG